MYEKYVKRVFDIVLSVTVITLGMPLFLVLWIGVVCGVGFPVFFKQERTGYKERRFKILKFRSMTNECDSEGRLLPDSERVTQFGMFLRHSSLDELPQVFNVLIGDMSIVGPRPLPPSYLPYYYSEERLRHSVRPGITGLAQVSGRTSLTWDKKLALDVQYVKGLSFGLDCKILFRTIGRVLGKSDIRDFAIEGPLSQCRERQDIAGGEADWNDGIEN